MRISDWSSDVCSSDLDLAGHRRQNRAVACDTSGGAYGAPRRQLPDRAALGDEHGGCRFVGSGTVECDIDALAVEQKGSGADIGRIEPEACLERRSEEHTSELQSLMSISYAVFCLKKKKNEH